MNKDFPLCKYDEDHSFCERCPYADCVRDDIEGDDSIRDLYFTRDYKKTNIKDQMNGKVFEDRKEYRREYQRAYRAKMSAEKKEKYLAHQRKYQREYFNRWLESLTDEEKEKYYEERKQYHREYRRRKKEEKA